MLVSSSEDVRTSQFSVWVTCMAESEGAELSGTQKKHLPPQARESSWARAHLAWLLMLHCQDTAHLSPALQKLCCSISDPQQGHLPPHGSKYPTQTGMNMCFPGSIATPQ